jgi:hypothetical protein
MNPAASVRCRVNAAIITLTAAAAIVALTVVTPTPASAAGQPPASAAPTPALDSMLAATNVDAEAADSSRQAPADTAGAFLFRNGRFTPLGNVPGAAIAAHVNVNNRGQVVGLYLDDQGTPRSFVKNRSGRVTMFAVPGATATLAAAVNDRGQVAGTYYTPPYRLQDAAGTAPPPGTVHGSSVSPMAGSPPSTCPASTTPP